MDDFVVREREDEVFGEGVDHREGEVALMIFSVDGVFAEVVERVVHPAHVPFEVEPEAALIERMGYLREGGGLFCEGEEAGVFRVKKAVEVLEELYGLKVFATAVLVRYPLVLFAGIVEVEHGGDGIDAQAVEVIFLGPENGARKQESADFVATKVWNEGSPVHVLALTRVGVFIEMRAIEVAEAVRVFWEVGGHPVEDDANAFFVTAIDKEAEIIGRTEARGGREVAGGLIAPRSVERMFRDRQQLNVRVAHFLDIRNQFVRQFAVREPAVVLFGNPFPGAGVQFVNTDGAFLPVGGFTLFDPIGVVPLVVAEVANHGCGIGSKLALKGIRVGLLRPESILPFDLKFILIADFRAGNKPFPDARILDAIHSMNPRFPVIKRTNHANALSIRRPDGEVYALFAIFFQRMSPELFVGAVVSSLSLKEEIEIGQFRSFFHNVVSGIKAYLSFLRRVGRGQQRL